MSNVRFHVSHVRCHMSYFIFLFSDKVVGIVGGVFVISGAYPVYSSLIVVNLFTINFYMIAKKLPKKMVKGNICTYTWTA